MNAKQSPGGSDRQWYIVGRWQEYEGEGRANLLRIVAVGAFYGVQMIQFNSYSAPNEVQREFHQAATLAIVAWALLALAILLCLRRRIFPAVLKFISTGGDIVLLTSLAMIGTKANSPLVMGYFLVIGLAGLRFSLRLIWFATLASLLSYLALVGASDPVWFDADHVIPVAEQLLTLISLGLSGILLGQIVRRAKGMAYDYSQRLEAEKRKAA